MNLINEEQPRGFAMQVLKTADKISNVAIQPINVHFCALLFAGHTFAGYQQISSAQR